MTKEIKAKEFKAKAVQEGDKAPPFSLPTDGGGKVSLAGLKGKTVVLYFYPKNDTSGCTAQAIAFTKDAKAFKSAGAVVVGVSKDSPVSHDKFKAKHKLGVMLGADEDLAVANRYGTWVEKSMYGRRYMGMERATFLIDGQGRVRRIWRKVKVPGHSAEVLNAIDEFARNN
jgi:peroxiredoxin Q/BCP